MSKKKTRSKMNIVELIEKLKTYESLSEMSLNARQFANSIGYTKSIELWFGFRHQIGELDRLGKPVDEACMIYANRMAELVDETTQPTFVQALILHHSADAYRPNRANLPYMRKIMDQMAMKLLMSVSLGERHADWEYVHAEVCSCLSSSPHQ